MKNAIMIRYIWFKDYFGFHNQGINLSTKYRFTYNPDNGNFGTVTTDENPSEYIDNFFDDNIDVSAIVGRNGTGKTSLLQFIQGLRNGDIIETECVIVIERNSAFWAGRYYYENNQIKCMSLPINGYLMMELKLTPYEMQRLPLSKDIRFIYLTEMFSMSQYKPSFAGGDDLSFAAVLHDQTEFGEEEKHISNPIVKYIHRMTDWQLKFFSNGIEYAKNFNINFPSYLYINPSYDKDAFANFYIKIKLDDEKQSQSYQNDELKVEAKNNFHIFHNRNNNPIDDDSFKNEYAAAIFMNIFSSLQYMTNVSKAAEKLLFDIIEQTSKSSDSQNAWEALYKILLKIKDNNQNNIYPLNKNPSGVEKTANYIPVKAEKYIDFMDYFSQKLNDRELRINKSDYLFTIMIPTQNMDTIRTFFNKYKNCVSIVDFAYFSWGLSSGETLLLNQFGKLMHLLEKDENGRYFLPYDINSTARAYNAVILLDEAEVAFHPEWQRIYFNSILKFVKENISDQGTHIQMIIATHSPIILSDIPKQNTVFLAKDENKGRTISVENEETFAANIFSLYQNAFFLGESGIGAFAENKLCELIKKIHQLYGDEENPVLPSAAKEDEAVREISCIGDPYIRSKFKMEYEYIKEKSMAKIKELREDMEQKTDKSELSALDEEIRKTENRLEELKELRRKSGE